MSIRGQEVILDRDLAGMYGVSTKRLSEQVRRNRNRFPCDFMFQLTDAETQSLGPQSATARAGRGRRRTSRPYAFTEHGVAMLSGVLNGDRVVEATIAIIRAFVRQRDQASSNNDFARRLNELEQKYDENFHVVLDATRRLMLWRLIISALSK